MSKSGARSIGRRSAAGRTTNPRSDRNGTHWWPPTILAGAVPESLRWATVVISVLIGCYDLLRGFMHTILLHYSATNIAVLDLTTSTARDQLKLLGAFGVSNLETGIAMILVGLFARKIALAMLGVIPLVHAIGYFTIRYNSEDTAPSTAHWGGVPMLKVYLCVCLATFVAGVVVMRRSAMLRKTKKWALQDSNL